MNTVIDPDAQLRAAFQQLRLAIAAVEAAMLSLAQGTNATTEAHTIALVVGEIYGVSWSLMQKRTKTSRVSKARFMAMSIASDKTKMRDDVLGSIFCRERSSVSHARRWVRSRELSDLEFSKELSVAVAAVEKKLGSP